jgi:hypothetical protein
MRPVHEIIDCTTYVSYGFQNKQFISSETEITNSLSTVHLPYEPGYVIPRVGNVTEEKSCISMLEIPSDL